MTDYYHPDFDPVFFNLFGPLQIRWYSLLYVGGFVVGRLILLRLSREGRLGLTRKDIEQMVMWVLIGAVIGARVIYCVFYDPRQLIADPMFLFKIYEGGLSFHGGMLGVIGVVYLFSRLKRVPFWNIMDAYAVAAAPGLGMGRIGNFINGELFGRVSYVPWAMVFKRGGYEPRHPSQLYEFLLEGVVLFAALWILRKYKRRDGDLSLAFLMLYSLFRFIVEFFREPDVQLGYLFAGLSMGQLLCAAMFFAALLIAWLRPSRRYG